MRGSTPCNIINIGKKEIKLVSVSRITDDIEDLSPPCLLGNSGDNAPVPLAPPGHTVNVRGYAMTRPTSTERHATKTHCG